MTIKAEIAKVHADVKKWKLSEWGAFASIVALGVVAWDKVKKKF